MSEAEPTRPGEFELIARFFSPLAAPKGTFGLLDDAASLAPPPGCDLVLTKDVLVAGVHFFPNDPPKAIAQKALRVNLSDLAAKGATHLGYLLGLGLPKGWDAAWLGEFSQGLAQDQATYGITLLGGDTVSSPERLVVSVTAIGAVPTGRMVRRGTAQPGELVFVTGTIGDAALGLQLRLNDGLARELKLSDPSQDHLLTRYLLPRPRTVAGDAMLQFARSGMDISDGLLGDLEKLGRASGVALHLDAARVPLSPAAQEMIAARPAFLRNALTGGDDYELAGTVAVDNASAFAAALRDVGVDLTIIGEVRGGQGLHVAGIDALENLSFRHF